MVKIIRSITLLLFSLASIHSTAAPVSGTVIVSKPAFTSINILTADSPYIIRVETKYKAAVGRLKQQAASLHDYIKANNFNAEYVFLVDMSIPSGKNRFFVYNVKKDAVETSSLVTHGVGSNRYENDDPLEFSNEPNSQKTSQGRYKIGKSYYGKFGLAYKLHGLDATNSKAYERDIVLHSHARVPEKECFPEYIIVSAGCPTVSPSFLSTIDKYIKASDKPILLWVYN